MQPLFHVGVVLGEMLFGPGNVHACSHQQTPELIVQFAGETGFLALRYALQMRREFDEFAGTFLDLALELQLLVA